jgi:hypothetical protein
VDGLYVPRKGSAKEIKIPDLGGDFGLDERCSNECKIAPADRSERRSLSSSGSFAILCGSLRRGVVKSLGHPRASSTLFMIDRVAWPGQARLQQGWCGEEDGCAATFVGDDSRLWVLPAPRRPGRPVIHPTGSGRSKVEGESEPAALRSARNKS